MPRISASAIPHHTRRGPDIAEAPSVTDSPSRADESAVSKENREMLVSTFFHAGIFGVILCTGIMDVCQARSEPTYRAGKCS